MSASRLDHRLNGAAPRKPDTLPPAGPGAWEGRAPAPAPPGSPAAGPTAAPPRTAPAYKPFPVDVLPDAVRGLALAAGAAVGCDPAFAALPALVAAGAAVGAALGVSPKRGWRELPALWGVSVGDSGTAKSPAADPARAAADRIEDALEEAHGRAATEFSSRLEAWKERPEGDRPRPPSREYFTADDITVERLIENLQTSPRGILVSQDELADWFGSFTRYRQGGGSDAARWLRMFDGRPVGYQRKTGAVKDVRVRRALVSVSGGIQPGVLRAAMADPAYVASGLAARLVFVMPPKHCPRFSEAELHQDVEQEFRRVLGELRALPFDPRADIPPAVRLDGMARARFVRYHDGNAGRAEDLDGGPMAAALPKLSRVSLRLALVHHCVALAGRGEDPGKSCVGEASMAAGVELSAWFGREADRVYAMLAESVADREVSGLLALVGRKGGRMTPRELMRTSQSRYPTAERAAAALDALAVAGFGFWVESTPGASGGCPSRALVLRSDAGDTTPGPGDATPGPGGANSGNAA